MEGVIPEITIPDVIKLKIKRGPGRPRKVVPGPVSMVKSKLYKKVSAGEGVKRRRAKKVLVSSPTATTSKPRLLIGTKEGIRRSSRIRDRAAVT